VKYTPLFKEAKVTAIIMKIARSNKFSINAPFGLGQIEFERETLSNKELDIAWKIYVQLATRKAAIEIDENEDSIEDIYNSWYELFTTTREYLTEMPAIELRGNQNAQKIVSLAVDVLNKGLRPHLTKWQKKYKKWYNQAANTQEHKNKDPQEIQKYFPEFNDLVKDMKNVNHGLMKYAEELKKITHEEKPSFWNLALIKIQRIFK
jgi:DNA repair ATPase RecN